MRQHLLRVTTSFYWLIAVWDLRLVEWQAIGTSIAPRKTCISLMLPGYFITESYILHFWTLLFSQFCTWQTKKAIFIDNYQGKALSAASRLCFKMSIPVYRSGSSAHGCLTRLRTWATNRWVSAVIRRPVFSTFWSTPPALNIHIFVSALAVINTGTKELQFPNHNLVW